MDGAENVPVLCKVPFYLNVCKYHAWCLLTGVPQKKSKAPVPHTHFQKKNLYLTTYVLLCLD